MKKKYTLFTMKMIGFLLVVLFISAAVWTYNEAQKIKNGYWDNFEDEQYTLLEEFLSIREFCSINEESRDDLIKKVYEKMEKGYIGDDEIGFYCEVKDNQGNVLAQSQNYITVIRGMDHEKRFILLKNSTDKKVFNASDVHVLQIEGVCNDTFIYPSKIVWTNRDLEEDEEHEIFFDNSDEQSNLSTMSFKEWIGEKGYYTDVNFVGTWYGGNANRKQSRNDDARKINEKIDSEYGFSYVESSGDFSNEEISTTYDDGYDDNYDADYNDVIQDISSESIFTTYDASRVYLNEDVVMSYVYVYHPLAIAMSELADIYKILLVIAIVMIIIICQMVKKLYTQQQEFELRTRKMTRGVAHELKTPLAITKTYVENWQYIDEEDRDDYCKNMVDEIDHMNMLVNDLLELSRMECGAKKLQKEAVDILALTNTINAHMKGMMDERNLEINIITDKNEQEYLVNADLEMMRIVINNFMSNAVKYADKKIAVYLSEAGKKITFKIENDGQGISKQDIDRVWDTFYKTDDSRSNRIGSSGLGLAITKNILMLHEAEYGCSSEQGKTTFWFKLKKMEE